MRQIRSNLEILRRLWTESITIGTIAEPLASRPILAHAADVQSLMETHNWDVLGLTETEQPQAPVIAYLFRADLGTGRCGDHKHTFSIDQLVSTYTPVRQALSRLIEQERLFVLGCNGVDSIVTVADLGKQPVRLLLFSVISLLEMALLRLIRRQYPDDAWNGLISNDRLSDAQHLLEQRKQKDQDIDLADCLQLADKMTILMKTDGVCSRCGFTSKRKACDFSKNLQTLRDNLAHSQDLASGMEWRDISDTLERAERMLESAIAEGEPTAS